jgi:hypothetical protein
MRSVLAVALLVLMAAWVATAQEVFVDYDASIEAGKYSSFDWVPTPETSLEEIDPQLHSQVKNAIEYHLTRGGLVQVATTPELLVTYHTEVVGLVRLDAASYGYDYGPWWTWDPDWGEHAGDYRQKVRTYPRGSLIIDIWDMATGTVVWRGTVVGVVADNPSEAVDELHLALEAMVAKWQEVRPSGAVNSEQ